MTAVDTSRYAPEIDVRIDGKKLGESVLRDIIELRITMEKDKPAAFSITLANVDPRAPLRDGSDQPFKYSDNDLLDVEGDIFIKLGYAGAPLIAMIAGKIKTFAPSFPQSGLSTLAITGVDKLGDMLRSKPGDNDQRAYKGKSYTEIVKAIGNRHKLQVKVTGDDNSPPEFTPQKDQDDLKFLLDLARKGSFECYCRVDGEGTPTLFFEKRGALPPATFQFAWGKSLLSFTPTLTVGKRVTSVTVRGWDPRKKKAIQYKATSKDLPATHTKGRNAAKILEKSGDPKEERIVDHPVKTVEEAKQLAISLFARDANEFLTASGEVMGEPGIRPGTAVELQGVGHRFNGSYTVKKATHVFGSAGYLTSFEVERMYENEEPRQAS